MFSPAQATAEGHRIVDSLMRCCGIAEFGKVEGEIGLRSPSEWGLLFSLVDSPRA